MPTKFDTLSLLTFRTEEHVYWERVERERVYAADAALFALQGTILINTLVNLPTGTIPLDFVSPL
jgi:hypothetical protein